jgi:putative transposase
MMDPLVGDLADDGIPVTVTYRVLKIARQPYYRWHANPVTSAELDEAYVANVAFDAHRDDPEFGYRFLADEVRQAGHELCDRTVWRICRDNGWWSSFGKPRRHKGRPPGTPAHEDLVGATSPPTARTSSGSWT